MVLGLVVVLAGLTAVAAGFGFCGCVLLVSAGCFPPGWVCIIWFLVLGGCGFWVLCLLVFGFVGFGCWQVLVVLRV